MSKSGLINFCLSYDFSCSKIWYCTLRFVENFPKHFVAFERSGHIEVECEAGTVCTMGLFWKCYRFFHWLLRSCAGNWVRRGDLYDDVLWLILLQESFRVLLSYANYGHCYLNLAGIVKFKYERKNKMDSGSSSSSKMTLSYSFPYTVPFTTFTVTIIHLVYHPKFCLSIVLMSSSEDCNTPPPKKKKKKKKKLEKII